MKSARAWKDFYRAERERLGESGLARLLDRAPRVDLPDQGAIVFPHTRLETSGELAAAAALAVLRSGCEEVLALGVLHGAREQDAESVRAARGGDPAAIARLRGVHGPGLSGEAWTEEFSLDGFAALLELAARREGTRAPTLHARYPFLVGEHPETLPGFDALRALARRGALVATADPIHHGAGYGTPEGERLPRDDARTREVARASIRAGFERLASRDFRGFLDHCAQERSDFRDPGPVLAALMGELTAHLAGLALVDYADVLGAAEPTWVAGGLVVVEARRARQG